jgi:GMP synthase-like glutamine amidotransferase
MTAKRVLVVQNYENEGLGGLGKAFDETDLEIELHKSYSGEPLPTDASGYDALVILGGAQNALDDEGSPYFPHLLDLIREFEAKDLSVLGICLGSQLMARAFGGTNQVGGATEFGWKEVVALPAAELDPVLGRMSGPFPMFEWHDDTFGLPDRAELLASNDTVKNQAFRIGRAAYGFQFHFEADTELVAQWNTDFAHLLANKPGWLEGRYARELAEHGSAADAAGLAIARAWIATI